MQNRKRKIKKILPKIIVIFCIWLLGCSSLVFGAAESLNIGLQVVGTAVTISNVTTSNITENSAQVFWNTNPQAECDLRYGRTIAFSDGTITETSFDTNHSHAISGLVQGDHYYYEINCEASGGEEGDAGSFEFDTLFALPVVDVSVDTENKKAEFSGTGRSGWTIHIKVTGESNFFRDVVPDSDGSWKYKTNKLDAGKYYVEVYYENEHGEESAMSTKKSFEIEKDNNEDNNGQDEENTGGEDEIIVVPPVTDDETPQEEEIPVEIVEPEDEIEGGVEEEAGIIGGKEKEEDEEDGIVSKLMDSFKLISATDKITKTVAEAAKALKESTEAVEKVIAENQTQVSVLSGAGVVAGTLPFLFQLNSLKDIGLLLRSSFSLITGIFISRRRRDWGVIYDSRDGKPIPLAVISIFTEDGRLAEKKVSDSLGTYSFLVPSGTYSIKVEKNGYEFLSEGINPGAYSANNYAGQMLNVKKDDVIKNDIPLKPRIEAIQRAFLGRKIVDFVAGFVFFCGLTLSVVAMLLNPTVFNGLILGIYLAGGMIRFFAGTGAKWGTILGNNGVAASFAIIKAFDKESGKLIARTISDEHGRYYLILDQGDYNVEVSSSILSGQKWSGEVILDKRSAVKKKIKLG